MESLGDSGIDPLCLRRFGQSFASLPVQGHFGSSPVQIFRQYNLNSKLKFDQIPVVISKFSIYVTHCCTGTSVTVYPRKYVTKKTSVPRKKSGKNRQNSIRLSFTISVTEKEAKNFRFSHFRINLPQINTFFSTSCLF